MPLKLYNTLTRKKEVFKPIKDKQVGMYVCGPTIYNFVHLGNLRAYVFADILRRTLKSNEFKIMQVMNLTDVDDKTIRDSQKAGIKLKEFTKKYEKGFLEDLEKMNIETPEVMPKATEHIQEMVELVKKLLEKEIAYKTEDGIYFSIKKFKNYGKLSGIKTKKLKVGASERILKDEYDKENVNDFVLWKFYDKNDGDVFWNTEIGKGRPGWHIECSAMSSKYLGKQFDIHTGGVDLIFPHHENEIAQSEAAFDVKPWVKYWMHNEWVLVDGEKMSKSKGNFYNLKDIEEKNYSSMDLRYFYLSAHYRKPLNFTFTNLDASKNTIKRLKNIISEIKNSEEKINKNDVEQCYKEFLKVLNDDLNTPRALSYMWEILRDDKLNNSEKYELVLKFDKVFGLKLEENKKIEIPDKVKKLLKIREEARKEKDWKTSDELREEIKKLGWYVNDTKEGSEVEKI
jgi:cysteinyl-tRNA synthetase